eukprot:1279818-Prymnesium_polylepis.1
MSACCAASANRQKKPRSCFSSSPSALRFRRSLTIVTARSKSCALRCSIMPDTLMTLMRRKVRIM